jgi:hypothetical protein
LIGLLELIIFRLKRFLILVEYYWVKYLIYYHQQDEKHISKRQLNYLKMLYVIYL